MDNVIIYDAIDGVLNECETVMGGVNNIQGTLSASNLISADSVVKSVQRGHVVGEVGDEHEINVPISTIEIDKSILICSFDEEHEYQYTMYPILSSNKITLKSDNFLVIGDLRM